MNILVYRRELPMDISKAQLRGWLEDIYVMFIGDRRAIRRLIRC